MTVVAAAAMTETPGAGTETPAGVGTDTAGIAEGETARVVAAVEEGGLAMPSRRGSVATETPADSPTTKPAGLGAGALVLFVYIYDICRIVSSIM